MQLFSLSLFIIGIFGHFASGIAIKESEKLDYRLNADIKPLRYVIDVTPYFDNSVTGKKFTFDGITAITFKTSKPNVDTITLHKYNLDIVDQSLIRNQSLYPQRIERINITSSEYDNRTEKYTLKLASTLVKNGIYTLNFKYIGSLTNSNGFYRTAYREGNVTKWLASTHMEPANARKMFPCFDEPRFKATFLVIVNRPAHFKPSLSNMPLVSSEPASSKVIREYFAETPKMSTYLVAVVVSEFVCRENALKDFSVCFQPSAYDQSEYSFNFGQKMLKTFDELFDYAYNTHMAKMTMAAVPYFGGGMENWGLIIYGDKSVLEHSKSLTPSRQQSIAGLITHELAHMWFGDLVTCQWWDNTWLNEGFATYFQTFGLALIEPSWSVDQQFVVDKIQSVFSDDSLETSLALNHDANTSDELHARFGSITYTKGASVIRMFSHILGNEKFIAGLRNYFKQNALKTAVPETLYSSFQKEVENDFNVTKIFDSWVSQPGFPVINVHIASDRKHIEIRQKRFLQKNPNHDDKTQWNVPLTWASNNENTDFSHTKPMAMLLDSSLHITMTKPIDWIIFNVQQSGYYRVNYDDVTWSAIANMLHKSYSTVHVLNRAQIIDDVLKLARFSYSNYETAIRVVDYLQNEIDYVPWKSAFNNLDFILARVKPEELQIFQKFETKLLNKVYEYLGFHSKANDTHLDTFNRNIIVKNACRAGLKQCLADARAEYNLLLKGNYTIPDDLMPVVYCSIVEHGTDKEWNFLWNRFKSTHHDHERGNILNALGCTKQTDLVKKYLEYILSNEIKLQNKHNALLSTLTQKKNLQLVLNFVITKHKTIDTVFETENEVPRILSQIATLSTTNDLISRIQKFAKKNGLDSMTNVKTALENTKLNLQWAEKNIPIILKAIKKTENK